MKELQGASVRDIYFIVELKSGRLLVNDKTAQHLVTSFSKHSETLRRAPIMSRIRFTLITFGLVMFVLAVASTGHAQATRTWVSGVGDDVNPCSRTAPCKTFAGAV